MSRRKEPRLHVRFESFSLLDKIEIWANRQGEKILPWARKALIAQARKEKAHEIISDTADFSVLEALCLLREIAGPEASKRATEQANTYVNKVKDDVRDELA